VRSILFARAVRDRIGSRLAERARLRNWAQINRRDVAENVVDDKSHAAPRPFALEVRLPVERVLLNKLDDDSVRDLVELIEPSVDQAVLEGGHDGDVDDRERSRDERDQRETELDADGSEPHHESRNL
jgi:hypothetical protein